ncbi:MAG TPA: c-type cytochrome [Caldimonas sp.]|jgi:cytochrome c553|nr:c-type cytochrome [Caldimonas sp.]HEX4234672.1 c-type cytochrome [Caldimonas sp.]
MKKLLSLPSFANLVVALLLGVGGAANAQDAKPGDPVAGEKKAEMCAGCHSIPRYQASFPEVYKVPKIAGQGAKYIVSALMAYRKGDRKHPSMRGIAGSLSDQDMADLGAYFEQLGKGGDDDGATQAATHSEPPAPVAKLLSQANCASCHGANFSTPIDPSYPKLAGQHADYLYAALKSYQTDHNPRVGRNNAIMMGMARPFTHPEIKALAAYISSLPGDLKTVPQSRFR